MQPRTANKLKAMPNIAKNFEITYPLKHKVVRDLKIVTETVGYLLVTGVAYCDTNAPKIDVFDRYGIDIDFVTWTGTDIKPVLEVTGAMDDIIEYCIERIAHLFENSEAA